MANCNDRLELVGPNVLTEEVKTSVYHFLSACTPCPIDKIVGAVIRETFHDQARGNALFEDIRQAVIVKWLNYKPAAGFSAGECAAYAKKIARHEVLDFIRSNEAPVTLKGNAFRKRADGSAYVSQGVFSAPVDFHELQEVLNCDDPASGRLSSDHADLIQDADSQEREREHIEQHGYRRKLLERAKAKMSEHQYQIVDEMLNGAEIADIKKKPRGNRNAQAFMLALSEASYHLAAAEREIQAEGIGHRIDDELPEPEFTAFPVDHEPVIHFDENNQGLLDLEPLPDDPEIWISHRAHGPLSNIKKSAN